jgi:hypothetical protein
MGGPDQPAAALGACRIAARDVLDARKLDRGTYNMVYRIRRRDGDSWTATAKPAARRP